MPTKKSIAALAAALKENNDAYNALPPMKKRVATAKEIIAEIELGEFRPGSGYGSVLRLENKKFKETTGHFPTGDLQQHIIKGGFVCEGCAKAAVIVARAKLGDNVHLDTNNDSYDIAHEVSSEIFGKVCADIIESIYENADEDDLELQTLTLRQRRAIVKYSESLPDRFGETTLRMKAIYQNIIDNKGRLVIGNDKY